MSSFIAEIEAYKQTHGIVAVATPECSGFLEEIAQAKARRARNAPVRRGSDQFDIRHVFRVSRQRGGVRHW